MEKIFVQIASYRDPELINTILDCFKKAKYPERIFFGICWQRCKQDKFDDITPFKQDPRFKIIEVDYMDSLGCCWARNKIQNLWDGEEYTLQIDSHMIFNKNWDESFINYLKSCDSKKPILSVYPNSYTTNNRHNLSYTPSYMKVNEINEDGIVSFISHTIEKELDKPIKAKFLAAGFIFTLGKFCEECIYDPQLYFLGEEMTLVARSFTHGYDIYHPPKNLIWHLYKTKETEEENFTHWSDHVNFTEEKNNWTHLNKISVERIKKLFGIESQREDMGIYGFGTERTLEEYQDYCGVDFVNKKIIEDVNLF